MAAQSVRLFGSRQLQFLTHQASATAAAAMYTPSTSGAALTISAMFDQNIPKSMNPGSPSP
ncbi:hypothetical protein UNPF46_19880 [Bradyrhizobium sp. UNPF46]|nr:hypothetical protein UNPF46_19880 [Bradyrhizobium sp. UNPF46]